MDILTDENEESSRGGEIREERIQIPGTGICAHESAMQDGKVISIPAFEKVE